MLYLKLLLNLLITLGLAKPLSSNNILSRRLNDKIMLQNENQLMNDTARFYMPYSQFLPSVVFGDTYYLVVWQDNRGAGGSFDIYGARVSRSGTVIDSNIIAISTMENEQVCPSVAFDGINYFVIWQYYGENSWFSDVFGARVSQLGIPLDPNGISISTDTNGQRYPTLAFNGTNYLAVWEDHRTGCTIYGTRINQAGSVLDPQGIPISTVTNSQWTPSVASDGANYLVVWAQFNIDSDWDICGARVNQAGNVIDTNLIPISTVTDSQTLPNVAFDGTTYLVVWQDHRNGQHDIYGARVNQNGIVLDTAAIAISTAIRGQWSPKIAFDGNNYLVVWQDYRNGSHDIYGARVSRSGIDLDTAGIAISTAPFWQRYPSVAFDGTNYLVVWEDNRNGSSWDIYGSRVSPAGIVLDSNGFIISNVGIKENRQPFTPNRFPLEIYPNPAKSFLAIRLPLSADRTELKIFDVSGKLIKEIASTTMLPRNDRNGEIKVSLKGINPGIYFLRLGNEVIKFLVVK
jgi:Secretion system C-terminal sorting domain